MKRLSLAIMFVFCTLAMAAQDGIKVKFQGASPDIMDFAWSYVTSSDGEEDGEVDESTNALRQALERYRKGQSQPEGYTVTVDQKAGYILVESRHDGFISKWEMCYWNMADKKHKLFAFSNWSYFNDLPDQGQYDTLVFLRYTNATKKMEFCAPPGFEVTYEQNTTYSLPRVGKDIIINKWDKDGLKTQKTLKWNGHGFNK